MTELEMGPVISNEDQAWQFLERALKDELGDDFKEVQFKNWPKIDLVICGEKYNSSLTAKNMRGLIEVQEYLYRCMGVILKDNPKINALTSQQKDAVEINFKISKGSAGIEISLTNGTGELLKQVCANMTPEMLAITIVGLGVVWGGTSVLRLFLQNRKELASEKLVEEGRQFTSDQETKRMEILANAVNRQPKIAAFQEHADDMHYSLIKSVSDAERVSIAGHTVKGEDLQKMVKNPPERSTEIRLDGRYKVQKVDTRDPNTYKLSVYNVETGEEFAATVKQDFMYQQEKMRDTLQAAEWDRLEVDLKINARRIRGAITNAVIIKAEAVEVKNS